MSLAYYQLQYRENKNLGGELVGGETPLRRDDR